jgi:hypothetical protein
MPEKTKMVHLPLKIWRVAKKAAIDKDETLVQWLTDAVLRKLEQEKGVK